MTDQRIIYPTPEGGVAILLPTGELSVEGTAAKDVPAGTPYRVVSVADIPTDRTFRNAWTADFSEPDGYGADYGVPAQSLPQEQ